MVVVKNEGNDSLRASEEGAFRKGAGGGSRSTNGSSLSIQQQAGECNVVAGTSTFDKSISPTEAKQAVLNPDGAFATAGSIREVAVYVGLRVAHPHV